MDDIHNVLLNLAANLIWLPVGALLAYVGFIMQVRLPRRRLWQIKDPTCLVVCAANSTTTNTGVYQRPSTGIGQVRALTLATRSLNKAYSKQLDIQNILLSKDHLQERIEHDLLILGGVKNNQVATKLLELLKDEQPVFQTPDAIYWRTQRDQQGLWSDYGAIEYVATAVKRQVVTDFGIIIRCQSPFTTRKRTVILFSGGHTYGTIAAAKYFTESLPGHLHKVLSGGKQNFVLLVSAHILDGYPTKIKLERSYAW